MRNNPCTRARKVRRTGGRRRRPRPSPRRMLHERGAVMLYCVPTGCRSSRSPY